MMNKLNLCLLVALCSMTSLSAQVENYSAGLNGQKLDWLLYYLDQHYVDDVNEENLTEIAIKSIVSELDPYSVYHDKEAVEKQANADKGYSGKAMGFNFYVLRDTALVTYVSDDGPADKAGLLRGDRLTVMNGQNITGTGQQIVRDMVNDQSIEELSFKVLRGNRELDISFKKDLIPWKSVNAAYMLTGTIGYIKLGKFTLKTMEEFNGSLDYLLSLGMQELVLDLRDNLGGVVNQAFALAEVFLPPGKLVYTKVDAGLEDETFVTKENGKFEKGKLVIMQNAKTASASEIFIGAMQDWDRAVVLGTSTYGKGLIQQSYKLGDGSNVRLTIGRYKTPTGRILQREVGTTNNDWMTPYKTTLQSNSLTAKLENVEVGFKGQSMTGRYLVMGPGGIVPDVYYEWIDNQDWTLFNELNNLGYLYQFTTEYVDTHRAEMVGEYRSVRQFHEDRIREAFMLKDLRIFLLNQNVSTTLPRNFPDNIIFQIKSWIASQLWHDNAFYEMDNMDDRLMFRAREIQEGRVHDILGISY